MIGQRAAHDAQRRTLSHAQRAVTPVLANEALHRLLLAALALMRPTTAMVASVAPPRIAVYGGSGYIGNRVCQALCDRRLRRRLHLANGKAVYGGDIIGFN